MSKKIALTIILLTYSLNVQTKESMTDEEYCKAMAESFTRISITMDRENTIDKGLTKEEIMQDFYRKCITAEADKNKKD